MERFEFVELIEILLELLKWIEIPEEFIILKESNEESVR